MDATDWDRLAVRIEEAGYGSSKLDGRIAQAFGWEIDPFTSSLDAIVSLIGSELPGWTWSRDRDGDMWLHSPPGPLNSVDSYRGSGETTWNAPKDLAAAFCRAMASLPVKETVPSKEDEHVG